MRKLWELPAPERRQVGQRPFDSFSQVLLPIRQERDSLLDSPPIPLSHLNNANSYPK